MASIDRFTITAFGGYLQQERPRHFVHQRPGGSPLVVLDVTNPRPQQLVTIHDGVDLDDAARALIGKGVSITDQFDRQFRASVIDAVPQVSTLTDGESTTTITWTLMLDA